MTDQQILYAARECRFDAMCDAMQWAADGDLDATITAILVEALKQATPGWSVEGRQRLFEREE